MNGWYDCFIEALYKKYPKKSELTEALMDLLSIERESAYRRLRKDIIFPAYELVKIASAWNISLDEIVGTDSRKISFTVQLLNYINPSDKELKEIEWAVERLDFFKEFPDMEYMEISNRLPRVLSSGFSNLRKYYLLRWMYQYLDEKTLSFSEITFPARVTELSAEYYVKMKNLANISFIWDNELFSQLIYGIRYFHSIYLITDEEKELIKNDLYTLLEYMSEVATKGCWPETGNKVNLYVSHLNIETNYSYYYSNEVKICRIHAFGKNEIYTVDPAITEDFWAWMQLKKRASVQISEADERSRIEFFMRQREVIESL